MIRLEQRRWYPVGREAAFDYITDPHNWPDYWPNLVSVADLDRARWQQPGDTMRVRMRLAGRKVDLRMTLDRFRAPSLVTYHTVQRGLPDAVHERHFEPAGDGFAYRLVVTYAPRAGLSGLLDRTVVKRGILGALRATLDHLDHLDRLLAGVEARRHAR